MPLLPRFQIHPQRATVHILPSTFKKLSFFFLYAGGSFLAPLFKERRKQLYVRCKHGVAENVG